MRQRGPLTFTKQRLPPRSNQLARTFKLSSSSRRSPTACRKAKAVAARVDELVAE